MRVGELAEYCTDPEEAERLMKEAINWGIQQNRRTVRTIKLERLWRGGVGTSKAEKLGVRLAKEAREGRGGLQVSFRPSLVPPSCCSYSFHFNPVNNAIALYSVVRLELQSSTVWSIQDGTYRPCHHVPEHY